jgi:hypothetical protein
MGNFLHKYNTDNVHSRAVIVGIVNLLNSKVFFENVLSDSVIDIVYVPFFYNMGGDERFLQDYFLQWNDCIHPRHADGNYDVIPRGIVTMDSKSIDSSKLTHRFVRGTFVKEVNGEIQQFNAFINSLPLSMTFTIEVEVDSNLDAFKVEQALMETFYKTQVFSVNFRGFRIPCQAGFSEEFGVEKTFQFSYQSNERILVKFNIEVETYYPVLDSTTLRSNANRMDIGGNSASLDETFPGRPKPSTFSFESPISQETFFSGGSLPITWTNTGPILRVNLYYRIAGTDTWIPIAKNQVNNGYYNWELPFFNSSGNEIVFEPQRSSITTSSGRGGKTRPIINALGEVEKIIIFDKGFSYGSTDIIEVGIFPTPPVLPANFIEPVIQANVIGGEVVGYTIVNQGAGFTPSSLTEIELKIEDANSELTYKELNEELSFTGDVDSTLPAPGNAYIKNVNPAVSSLLDKSLLIGLTVEGIGVPPGSTITYADPIQNRLGINNNVNAQITGGSYITSSTIGKIYIQ